MVVLQVEPACGKWHEVRKDLGLDAVPAFDELAACIVPCPHFREPNLACVSFRCTCAVVHEFFANFLVDFLSRVLTTTI